MFRRFPNGGSVNSVSRKGSIDQKRKPNAESKGGESCWEFFDGNLEILEIYDSWGSFLGGHGDKKLLDDVM